MIRWSDADLVVIDLDRDFTFNHEDAASKAGYSAYAGRVATGAAVMTILRGTVIAEEGEVKVEDGFGQFLGDRSKPMETLESERN